MYQIDQSLQNALAGGACGLRLRSGGADYEVLSAKLTSACCPSHLTIGSVNAAQLTARLWGACPPAEAEVTLEARLEQTYLPLGTFRVAESKLSDDVGELTAYDAAWYAMQGDYTPGDTPPATALTLLADVAGQCGLTLGDVSGYTDQSVSGELSGYDCKTLAGYLAALVGCNAVIDRAGRLALRSFDRGGRQVTPLDYYAGALKLDGEQQLTGLRMVKKTVTTRTDSDGLTVREEQSETYSAGTGTGLVLEVENPFATQAITDAVWLRLSAIGPFHTGSCTYFAGLDTEPGDLLSIRERGNQSVLLPALEVRLELDGGCRTAVSAPCSATDSTAPVSGEVGRMMDRLEADLGSFQELTARNFTAAQARINSLCTDDAWVSELFSRHIRANRLDVCGASRFSGVIDAAYAQIGGVNIAQIDNLYTREGVYDVGDGVDEPWEFVTSPDFPVPPGEQRELVKVGVWVTKQGAEGMPDFRIWLTQQQPYFTVEIDVSGVGFNESEVFIPVAHGTFDAGKIINWGGWPGENMAWADIHVKLYFGDQGALSAEGSIYTDEDFVEGGIPLSEKYAALYHDHDGAYADISHDHDGDYAALCHDHDSDYAALSHDHDGAYLSLDGGTLTDALNLANDTWNRIGDDAELGDCNVAGCVGLHGLNGNTGLYFEPRSGSTPQSITVNGNGTMSVTGDLSVAGTITCGTPPLVRERYETTATGDGRWAIPWEITAAKNGYTPIMWSAPIRGNSLTVKVGVETVLFGSGQLKVSGFTDLANGVSMPIRVDVLWLRNN